MKTSVFFHKKTPPQPISVSDVAVGGDCRVLALPRMGFRLSEFELVQPQVFCKFLQAPPLRCPLSDRRPQWCDVLGLLKRFPAMPLVSLFLCFLVYKSHHSRGVAQLKAE